MQELVIKNQIHDVQLTDCKNKTQSLAQQQGDSAGVKPSGVVRQEVTQSCNLVRQRSLCQWVFADLLNQLGDPSPLRSLPPGPGKIANTSLYDEQESDPLVVVVMDCILVLSGCLMSNLFQEINRI